MEFAGGSESAGGRESNGGSEFDRGPKYAGSRESAGGSVLRVESVFHVADEQSGQMIAAKMIDRAHEIANLPECECDVDVSVEWASPDGPANPGGPPAER